MAANFTAVIQQDQGWWIGWIEEVPGVNCQEATLDKLLESLSATLREAIEMNRQEALAMAGPNYREVCISL
ncbi:MAG: type II toxin-antitoxin system HicB family antitoxin [Magnetococcales bacterium]|nr:type II toxin-antitoxin system HicB family antitoxin [Magnetococcales bacterium]